MDFEGWTDERAIERVKQLPESLQPYVMVNDPYWCYVPSGWVELVEACHANLLRLAPDYKIHQIKEKFGGLRYYTDIPSNNDRAHDLIEHYESASFLVCDTCGQDGYRRNIREFVIATRCDGCVKQMDL